MEITVTIPEELAARAQSSGMSPDVYVERLLRKIADIAERHTGDRDSMREKLAADWEHYQRTGLHLDDSEVEGWLAALEKGNDSELPDLHA